MNNVETKNLFSREDLELAWERVCASVGSDVKDYFGINVISHNVTSYLDELYESLNNNRYQPNKPFKYFEPKKCGTQRTKTVLRINDAIIYQAVADRVGFQLYTQLSKTKDNVFGSVLSENVQKGMRILEDDEADFYFFEYYVSLYNRFIDGVSSTLESGNVEYKLETDITGFFDCIPHSVVLLKLHEYGIEKRLLDLLASCLNSWSGTRDNLTLNVGIPQGPPASFLLANILLDELDRKLIAEGFRYFRFMDDIRIYAASEEELLDVLVSIDRYLKGHALSLNASKTEIKSIESDKNKDALLDLYGVPFDEKLLEDEDEHEIIVQDETQLKDKSPKSKTLNLESANKIKSKLLSLIEDELLELVDVNKNIQKNQILSHETVRHFLTLSQRWRGFASSLIQLGKYKPNTNLIKVWLFGVEHMFWKANSMIWNLKLYDDLELHSKEYERLLKRLARFEWVKYQLLSIFYNVYPNNTERHQRAIYDLKNESSPLVRLGYYSVLIESLKEDSALSVSYGDALKNEKEEYVKEAVLSAIHYRNMQVSIDNLKTWFLK